MEGQSQDPAATGTTSSPVKGELVDRGAAEGFVGQAQMSPPAALPTSTVRNKRAPHGAERGPKQGDPGNSGTAAKVPAGFNRVCALLAEAVIGMMADTLLASTGQTPRAVAPALGATKQTTNSGSTRSPSNLDERITEELNQCGTTSPSALRAKLGLQRTPCTKALHRLVAKGVLIGEGSTRDRVYRLAQPSQAAAA